MSSDFAFSGKSATFRNEKFFRRLIPVWRKRNSVAVYGQGLLLSEVQKVGAKTRAGSGFSAAANFRCFQHLL